jgi:hypothetical protein
VLSAVSDQGLAHRHLLIQRVALIEDPKTETANPRDLPAVGDLSARDQLQQRRFALPVAADDADTVALGDAERDVVEDRNDRVAEFWMPSRRLEP